jgi:hypothetical protein
VNISHEIVGITVQPVVVIVSALVRAEFLIGATTNGVATIETFLFHSTNVLIKIQKNVLKLGSTVNKAKKSRIALTSTYKETKKIISEADIRNRAFEICQDNDKSSFSELDNWFYAERELSGYYL